MIGELQRAFRAYAAKPFLFMWGSILYVFFILVFLLSTVGLAMIALIVSFLLDYPIALDSPIVIASIVLLFLYFLYFTGGVNAALIRTYNDAVNGKKTSLIEFYQYALSHAPLMFGITLMRDLFIVLLIAPLGALYYFYLMDYELTDVLLGLYSAGVVFVLHFAATPAIVSCGLGELPFDAFRRVYFVIRNKHVLFLGLFILFSITWPFNLVPILQFVTLFFVYPLVLSAMALMINESR